MPSQPKRSSEIDAPTTAASEVAEERAEMRRVQVVARWNSWVQVHDPADDSLTWVDLSEHDHVPA